MIVFDVIYRNEHSRTTTHREASRAAATPSVGAGNVILAAQEPTIGPPKDGVYTSTEFSPIAPVIAETTGATVGQVHLNKDPSDGVSRSVPLVVSEPNDGPFVPALSLAAVMAYRGAPSGQSSSRPNGVQIGDRFVPTDGAKSMLLNFSPELSGPSKVISAADVIDGTVPAKKIDGKDRLHRRNVDSTLGDVKTGAGQQVDRHPRRDAPRQRGEHDAHRHLPRTGARLADAAVGRA